MLLVLFVASRRFQNTLYTVHLIFFSTLTPLLRLLSINHLLKGYSAYIYGELFLTPCIKMKSPNAEVIQRVTILKEAL